MAQNECGEAGRQARARSHGALYHGKKFEFYSKGNGMSVMMGFKQGNDHVIFKRPSHF